MENRWRWPVKLTAGMLCAGWMLAGGARGQAGGEAYKDTSLSFEKRAEDMVSRMTLEEKAGQITTTIQAVPRLGIPACRIGAEGLHGIQGGTVYPDGMALAAMFDPELLRRVAGAIGDEARSKAGGDGGGTVGGGTGLFLWCPTVNLARDPRWGRNLETYGEDPYLSAQLGAAYCRGLQGDDPKYVKVVATPKHLVVYSTEVGRQSSDAVVSERALREYYLPPFEGCLVEGKALSTMSAYNAINGVPCSANEWLLTTVLRQDWKFQGAVVTDSGAVSQVYTGHRYAQSEVEAAALAVNAGVDVITNAQATAGNAIVTAQKQGLLKEESLNRAVKNSLLVRFRLGVFDPPELLHWKQAAGPDEAAERKALALQAAREAIVLLRNEAAPRGFGMEKLLPLDLRRISSVAVVGANANVNLLGSYTSGANMISGTVLPVSTTVARGTVAEAIRTAVGERVAFRYAGTDETDAVAAAKASDVVIFVGGLDMRMEHTGTDRPDLNMPNDQRILLDRVIKANPLTILVLTGGSGIALEGLKEQVPAMVMYWYNGEQGPAALTEVLFGTYNPAGRLPMTFYRAVSDLPPMHDYEVTSGRTYMYLKKPATFAFGHGLSYTSFVYKNLRVELAPAGGERVSVDVTNTGAMDGEEVVQVYVRAVGAKAGLPRPDKQLAGFERVAIKRRETRTVRCSVGARSFAYWDVGKHEFVVEPGGYEVMVGASSEDVRVRGRVELE